MASDSETPIFHARFYTRADCSLCERAYPILQRLACEGLLTIEQVNIDGETALTELYGARIPVVALSTGEVYEGRISEFRLRQRLTRAAST